MMCPAACFTGFFCLTSAVTVGLTRGLALCLGNPEGATEATKFFSSLLLCFGYFILLNLSSNFLPIAFIDFSNQIAHTFVS